MDNDTTFKRVFSYPVMVRKLLDWFVGRLLGGQELVDRLDLARLRRLNEQTVAGSPANLHRFAGDMVWTAPFDESPDPDPNAWLDLVLLSEFQRTPDRLMPLRVRNYVDCHHLDAWRQQGRRHFGVEERLQPVLPIVIYSGRRKWNAPQRVIELVTPATAATPRVDLLSRESALFAGDGYLLLDIHRLGADDFQDDNAVSLLAELTNPSPGRRTAKLAANLLEVLADEQPELRQVLFEWIWQESGLDLGVQEMDRVERMDATTREDFLEGQVELWSDRLRAEGIEAGRAEARAEERELLVHLADLKFGSDTARRLTGLLAHTDDAARLSEVGGWIITCTTADELIERAAGNGKDR